MRKERCKGNDDTEREAEGSHSDRAGERPQAEGMEERGQGGVTPEEMLDLLCEFGHEMQVTKAMTTEEEMYGCKYILSYKGIICGSDLVDPWFVRDYIKKNVK